MDLLKTKIYLDKLNREFARLSKDPDNIVRIDVDIAASYVRQLYDAVLSDAVAVATPVARPEPPVPTRRPAAPRPPQVEEPVRRPAIPVPVPPPPVPAVMAPEPPVREVPRPAAPPPVMVEENPAPAAPPEPEVVVQAKAPVAASVSVEAEELFEEKQARELSEKLSELPIPDLKKAIALNDRLLLTRELFSGDGQAFDAALTALNSYTQFTDAKAYLLDHCVIRYGWLDKKRIGTAKNFIKLVRRRYK